MDRCNADRQAGAPHVDHSRSPLDRLKADKIANLSSDLKGDILLLGGMPLMHPTATKLR